MIVGLSTVFRHSSKCFSMLARARPRYFLVLDLEATCEENVRLEPAEIIEFPCLKVDSSSLEVVSKFRHFVRPVYSPELTSFCTRLTGITQEIVDESAEFPEVLAEFHSWLRSERLCPGGMGGEGAEWVFVTCGDWDVQYMFPEQCRLSGLPVPPYCSQWVNIKSVFTNAFSFWPRNLTEMLHYLKLGHKGKLHCGLDDCQNLTRILQCLCLGHSVTITSTSRNDSDSTISLPGT